MQRRLTRRDVADELGIHYDSLSQLIKRGLVRPSISMSSPPTERRGARSTLLFSSSDLDAARNALDQLTWLAVVTRDSWHRLTTDGLSYTLFSARHARQTDLMRPGNSMAFYVTGVSRFAGLAEITGRRQCKNTIWPRGVYPVRIPLEPRMMLAEHDGASAKQLLSSLSFVRNTVEWEQYFRGTIRLLTRPDYEVILAALEVCFDELVMS